jgi:hypothetical protein
VVQRWSDIYRDCGEYILTGVGARGSKETDGCPLTETSASNGNHI